MEGLQVISNSEVAKIFANYPDNVRDKMLALRELILESLQKLTQ